MTDLLPCPCCGEKAEILDHPNIKMFMIHCSNWCVMTLSKFTIEIATEVWNKRTNLENEK